ncbi:hypothetical protein THAOC_34155 [Thalassiosira oceanica]|uniref:Uncharacterized protein n=1 Tax=Thalassiosira oceanica TaxID=159749 RepID=K0R5N6_THAOC|nr:hypothetical protein THAOC_34155 [Thalassiosira oceanica]|eukprot:EJK47149.1 hypothetical protein THAOC_34155 [Thalassiosira oceanica]
MRVSVEELAHTHNRGDSPPAVAPHYHELVGVKGASPGFPDAPEARRGDVPPAPEQDEEVAVPRRVPRDRRRAGRGAGRRDPAGVIVVAGGEVQQEQLVDGHHGPQDEQGEPPEMASGGDPRGVASGSPRRPGGGHLGSIDIRPFSLTGSRGRRVWWVPSNVVVAPLPNSRSPLVTPALFLRLWPHQFAARE